MKFRASIRNPSFLWRLWFSERRIGGEVSGVRFHRIDNDFVSVDDPLSPDDVATLAHNQMVLLELSTAPAGEIVPIRPAPEPPVEPELAAEPEAVAPPTPRQQRPRVDLRAPQKGWPAQVSKR
jgi:hypothetical protein